MCDKEKHLNIHLNFKKRWFQQSIFCHHSVAVTLALRSISSLPVFIKRYSLIVCLCLSRWGRYQATQQHHNSAPLHSFSISASLSWETTAELHQKSCKYSKQSCKNYKSADSQTSGQCLFPIGNNCREASCTYAATSPIFVYIYMDIYVLSVFDPAVHSVS